MKRKMKSSITIAMSAVLSVLTFVPTTHGQPPARRFRTDTGIITPAVGQVLRITVIIDVDFGPTNVRFAWMKYMPSGCNSDGVCRHTIESQGATTPVMVDPNEGVSFDVQGTGAGVRVEVESNSRNVRVLGIVFDTNTKRIMAIIHPFSDFA
jgi:hypothetical protein